MQNDQTQKTLEERVLALEVKIRKYERIIFWFVVVNVVLVVVPAIGLIYEIPKFIDLYSGGLGI